jgi:hypothetical protein
LADRNPDSHHPADLAVRRVAQVTTRTGRTKPRSGAAINCSGGRPTKDRATGRRCYKPILGLEQLGPLVLFGAPAREERAR